MALSIKIRRFRQRQLAFGATQLVIHPLTLRIDEFRNLRCGYIQSIQKLVLLQANHMRKNLVNKAKINYKVRINLDQTINHSIHINIKQFQ